MTSKFLFIFLSLFTFIGVTYAYEGTDAGLAKLIVSYQDQRAIVASQKSVCGDTTECIESTEYLSSAKELILLRLSSFIYYYDSIEDRIIDDPRLAERDQATMRLGAEFLRKRVTAYENDVKGASNITDLRTLDLLLSDDLETSLGLLRIITSKLTIEDSTTLISQTIFATELTEKHLEAARVAGNNVSLAKKHLVQAQKSMREAEAYYTSANKDLVSITKSLRMVAGVRDVQYKLQEANSAHVKALDQLDTATTILERLYAQKPWKL